MPPCVADWLHGHTRASSDHVICCWTAKASPASVATSLVTCQGRLLSRCSRSGPPECACCSRVTLDASHTVCQEAHLHLGRPESKKPASSATPCPAQVRPAQAGQPVTCRALLSVMALCHCSLSWCRREGCWVARASPTSAQRQSCRMPVPPPSWRRGWLWSTDLTQVRRGALRCCALRGWCPQRSPSRAARTRARGGQGMGNP